MPKQTNAIDHKFHDNDRLSLSSEADIFTAYKHTCMPIDFSINREVIKDSVLETVLFAHAYATLHVLIHTH